MRTLLIATTALLFSLPALAQEEEEPVQARPNPTATKARKVTRKGRFARKVKGKTVAAKGEEEEESAMPVKPGEPQGTKALNPSRTYRGKSKRPAETIGVVGAGPELPGKKAQAKGRDVKSVKGRSVRLHNHKAQGDQ